MSYRESGNFVAKFFFLFFLAPPSPPSGVYSFSVASAVIQNTCINIIELDIMDSWDHRREALSSFATTDTRGGKKRNRHLSTKFFFFGFLVKVRMKFISGQFLTITVNVKSELSSIVVTCSINRLLINLTIINRKVTILLITIQCQQDCVYFLRSYVKLFVVCNFLRIFVKFSTDHNRESRGCICQLIVIIFCNYDCI